MTDAKTKKDTAKKAERIARLIAAGLCTKCMAPHDRGVRLCLICNDRHTAYRKAWRHRTGRSAQYKSPDDQSPCSLCQSPEHAYSQCPLTAPEPPVRIDKPPPLNPLLKIWIYAVPCPTCGAEADQPCRKMDRFRNSDRPRICPDHYTKNVSHAHAARRSVMKLAPRSVACPRCGADAGEDCQRINKTSDSPYEPDDYPNGSYFHAARIKALNATGGES